MPEKEFRLKQTRKGTPGKWLNLTKIIWNAEGDSLTFFLAIDVLPVLVIFFSSSFSSFFVEVSRTPPSRVLLLTPSRTCLDAAASLPPLWASNDSVLHLLLCEGLCIFSFDSLYYATPYLFSFSICRRQWWLSLLDLLCSEQARKSSVILRLLTSINSKIVGGHLFLNATSGTI
ncbi:BnaC03g42670D [Brassica napus]|uniref:(rape) hypothetical protein n=1 Tax=Brassica napus TaxID=3708 RepID=A0A078GG19_BRANA|nr:unnamed protein product [Brassica napus]CDY24294.1 BnaC03g42670D [Brassica napus]